MLPISTATDMDKPTFGTMADRIGPVGSNPFLHRIHIDAINGHVYGALASDGIEVF